MNQKQITINTQTLFIGGLLVFMLIFIIFLFISSQPSGKKILKNNAPAKQQNKEAAFLGDKGSTLEASEGKLIIDESTVDDGNMHSFNYYSTNKGKTIYFFVLKASDGTYRAAANACEVCFDSRKGFTQQGDLIRCENCQTTYKKDQIALEKGGCNPGPINPDVPVENGQLVLNVTDVESVAYLF